MTNERLINQEANFVLDALCDRQPVQLVQSMGHVITRSQTSHEPCCRIIDSLQRCQCRCWKPDKDSVTVVKTRQNDSRHQSCSDVTAKLLSYRTQTTQVVEARLPSSWKWYEMIQQFPLFMHSWRWATISQKLHNNNYFLTLGRYVPEAV